MGILIGVGGSKPAFPYDYFYGIEFDTNVSQSACTRIGRVDLHKSLPVQSLMRRCIVNDHDGTVVQYLNANDSTKYDNGSTADLSGATGQVMVELPKFYIKFEAEGTKRRVLMSLFPLPGFNEVPKAYISAYEATIKRSTDQLCSVVNLDPDFRGGNNQSDWDSLSKSQLGKPATSTSLTSFRTKARKSRTNEWNCNTYNLHRELYWLFAVEYANLNCQTPFTAEPTEEGFKQGGLGDGVTTLNGSKWSSFSGYYPVIPCGTTNSLGNATGVVEYSMPAEYDPSTPTVQVPSYRGVENPFGHIWKWTDGVLINIQAEDAGGRSIAYTCDDPEKYASTIGEGYKEAGDIARTEGYVKEVCFGNNGEILPKVVGGASSTYFGDYNYTNIPSAGESTRGVLFGGHAYYGTYAGFVYAYSNYAPSSTTALIGSRLCFLPKSQIDPMR